MYEAFAARFGVPIRQLYGLTEAGDVALNMAPRSELDPASVGQPIGTVRVTIDPQFVSSALQFEADTR